MRKLLAPFFYRNKHRFHFLKLNETISTVSTARYCRYFTFFLYILETVSTIDVVATQCPSNVVNPCVVY